MTFAPSFEATIEGNPSPAPSSTPTLPLPKNLSRASVLGVMNPSSPSFAHFVSLLLNSYKETVEILDIHSARTLEPSQRATPVFWRPKPPHESSTLSVCLDASFDGVAERSLTSELPTNPSAGKEILIVLFEWRSSLNFSYL